MLRRVRKYLQPSSIVDVSSLENRVCDLALRFALHPRSSSSLLLPLHSLARHVCILFSAEISLLCIQTLLALLRRVEIYFRVVKDSNPFSFPSPKYVRHIRLSLPYAELELEGFEAARQLDLTGCLAFVFDLCVLCCFRVGNILQILEYLRNSNRTTRARFSGSFAITLLSGIAS